MALFTGWRRTRLRALPLPAEWERMIESNVPIFRRLSSADKRELLGHTHVLLDEKTFEGCGGLELTDEIRVTVAAHASVLLLHRETDYFPRLKSILVYPSAYVMSGERHVGDGIWEEGETVLLGHTAPRLAVVVVGWDGVPGGARDVREGHNVVLHEFAHQLDFENDVVDGTPLLEPTQGEAWHRVLTAEYEALRRSIDEGEETLIGSYGAKNPAEFFAVTTELFFECGATLRDRHPSLYEQFRAFYQQDPASWGSPMSGNRIS